MKTSELTGVLLDFWVAEAEGYEPVPGSTIPKGDFMWKAPRATGPDVGWMSHKFSQDWALAGPIIEREKIDLSPPPANGGANWQAAVGGWPSEIGAPRFGAFSGPTPLIAAMRAFVASKLGDELPDMPKR